MTTDKKLTVKRLIIFIVFSCVPLIIGTLILNKINGKPIYADLSLENAGVFTLFLGVFGMLFPSAAVLITRLATKEGMKNSFLYLNFKGNAKYYIMSVIIIPVCAFLQLLIILTVYGGGYPLSELFDLSDFGIRICTYLINLIYSVYFFFPAFGEEWGWRGYMMPKLCELMPKWAAIIVGGIIWGLWHAPLTVSGHNFGVDYPGFPWVGILLMCLFCILMNGILTYLTERTGSIYPASFCHMILDCAGAGVMLAVFVKTENISVIPVVESFLAEMLPIFAVFAVCFFLLVRKEKDTSASS